MMKNCNYKPIDVHYILHILKICVFPFPRQPFMSKQVHSERGMAQWLERLTLPMSLPELRYRIPLGAGYIYPTILYIYTYGECQYTRQYTRGMYHHR